MIDGLSVPIKIEYERWHKEIGEHDPYLTTHTIGIHDVLRAHFLLVDHFYNANEGLGGRWA